ncbi:PKD domain-containing protein [Sanguibacter sp. A247]|uniref:PKD domain-containing protein n=1 Tax=unclassified Sanguibacter TaxID=2645534 RepID=UPI003FD6D33C
MPDAHPVLTAWCAGAQDIDLYEITCPDGTAFVWPTLARTLDPATNKWGPWRLVTPPCVPVDDGTLTSDDPIADAVARELKTLKIPAKRAQIAPVTDWFPVQLPMTYYTDAEPETLTTTVLGTDVELELTPTTFTWDPGDGTAAITSKAPGASFPDDTITHVYKKVGEYRITLTTTWEGRFRITGADTWRPITGTGSTTHTTASFETREIRSVLS